MEGTVVQPHRTSFGEITVVEAEPIRLRRPGAATTFDVPRLKYTWQPHEALHGQLPDGFALTLQCAIGPDGVRRFYPWDSWETFLALASAGGLAILAQRLQLSGHERHSYRAMRLLFLRAGRMGEFYRHQFEHRQDLTVVPSGRRDSTQTDILPDDLGLDPFGHGTRWSVRELIQRGAEAARSAGDREPTTGQCIRFGFMEAARHNPLPVEADRVPLLVRTALFHVDPADEPDSQLVEVVTERLLTALHLHLEDGGEAFEKWFLGPKNSLVHQLSKQKRSPGGQLDEAAVRQVLLHLGWQSYESGSNCLHAQMRTFQNALPHPLRDPERLLFEHMYQRQLYLGNLPLALLIPRLTFLKEMLWEMWEHLPDLSRVPVFHRLLDYYSILANRRRQADRLIKSGRPVTFIENAYVPPTRSDLFQAIAAEVREVRQMDCGCPQRDWCAELKGRPRTKVRILHRCLACAFEKETSLTREEFAEIGRSIL